MDHLDLSVWAFEKLSEHRWGVIGIKYREVPCGFVPAKVAPVPPEGPFWGEDPEAYGQKCPKYAFPRNPLFVAPEPVEPVEVPKPTVLYGDKNSAFELSNWKADVWEAQGAGVNGSHGICGKVYPGGAISLRGEQGSFNGHMMVEFWTRTAEGVANAAINIQGKNRGCHPLMFKELLPVEEQEGYSRFNVALSQFMTGDHAPINTPNPSDFVGCNGMEVEEIQRVSFHNYETFEQFFCIDEVALTSHVSEQDN
eukprot:TRINITY_DN1285_c2_g1_i6.p1 TRINITY_DN1285_c2_g1~~TRINITY_DN1285_c2_g1_i6.p1  ORF type:complete len:289 (+),score=35.78 TRINITY_DN1285_c2_g1_i6:110-868(+)